jgi:parvulin-like peptidyl-prolyl isomerase
MEDALFRMKVGDVSDPAKYEGFWWVIRCVDKQPAQKRAFAEVKDEAHMGVALTKGLPSNLKKVEEDFVKFQKESNVQAFWPQYKGAVTIGSVKK